MSNIENLQNGLEIIKSLKPVDSIAAKDKWQKLHRVNEAIEILTGNLPEYITKALKSGAVTQKEVDAHIERTVDAAVKICTNITLKSI